MITSLWVIGVWFYGINGNEEYRRLAEAIAKCYEYGFRTPITGMGVSYREIIESAISARVKAILGYPFVFTAIPREVSFGPDVSEGVIICHSAFPTRPEKILYFIIAYNIVKPSWYVEVMDVTLRRRYAAEVPPSMVPMQQWIPPAT